MTELPVGNVSESTVGFWGRYKFTDGELKGFSAGLGLNYASKKVITDSANSTWYGYVPARPPVNAFFSYDHGAFRYNLNIDNLFNKKYIYADRNQSLIIPGTGFNVKAAITHKF
jgi:iron complex outermembrane receptor protein